MLFLIDPIDEVAIQNLKSYKEKNFVDISKEDLDLGQSVESFSFCSIPFCLTSSGIVSSLLEMLVQVIRMRKRRRKSSKNLAKHVIGSRNGWVTRLQVSRYPAV